MATLSYPANQQVSLCEALDRVLDTGAVAAGELTISLAEIDLIYLGLQLVVTSIKTVHPAPGPRRVPTCARTRERLKMPPAGRPAFSLAPLRAEGQGEASVPSIPGPGFRDLGNCPASGRPPGEAPSDPRPTAAGLPPTPNPHRPSAEPAGAPVALPVKGAAPSSAAATAPPAVPAPVRFTPGAGADPARREARAKNGLGKLVLTLMKLLHELLERQALRRLESGSLSLSQIDQLGTALMQQAQEIDRLRQEFGLEADELNLDLGPLGRLL